MHHTDYTFKQHKNVLKKFFTSIASKIMSPYQYWLENAVKLFSLQVIFLRLCVYYLRTDESFPSFLSISQKVTHHQSNTKKLQYKKTQHYIFAKCKNTSPFRMTNMYTLDQSKITDYLRIYDPNRQYFCILPHNDTNLRLIVLQEYLKLFHNFLLPCNISSQIVE